MKTEQIVILVVAFFLGMLLLNMVKNVCGCDVKEGFSPSELPPGATTDTDWMICNQMLNLCGRAGQVGPDEACDALMDINSKDDILSTSLPDCNKSYKELKDERQGLVNNEEEEDACVLNFTDFKSKSINYYSCTPPTPPVVTPPAPPSTLSHGGGAGVSGGETEGAVLLKSPTFRISGTGTGAVNPVQHFLRDSAYVVPPPSHPSHGGGATPHPLPSHSGGEGGETDGTRTYKPVEGTDVMRRMSECPTESGSADWDGCKNGGRCKMGNQVVPNIPGVVCDCIFPWTGPICEDTLWEVYNDQRGIPLSESLLIMSNDNSNELDKFLVQPRRINSVKYNINVSEQYNKFGYTVNGNASECQLLTSNDYDKLFNIYNNTSNYKLCYLKETEGLEQCPAFVSDVMGPALAAGRT